MRKRINKLPNRAKSAITYSLGFFISLAYFIVATVVSR